jgi:acyl dehydratase
VTLPGVRLGLRSGPFRGGLSSDLIRQYAAATNDPAASVRAGAAVPPVAVVTQIWDAQVGGRDATVPAELQQAALGGVHGEHDIVLHRPIVPGEPLDIWVEAHGSKPAGKNSLVTLRYEALDANGQLVVEQWWTTVYLGVTCERVGAPPPDHAFPADARQRPFGTYRIEPDTEMPRRYAEVSGDWSPHHFDLEAAQQNGFPRPFLHGLCTMTLCAQGVVQLAADGDPDRVRRIAVRFATPTFVGEVVDVHVYDAGELGVAFEAESAGALVVAHGRAELR